MENEKINYKLVIVEWVEVQTSLENIHIDDLKEIRPLTNVSTGFLLRKTNKNITIGFSLKSKDWINQYQIIPRDLIKTMIIIPPEIYQDFDMTKEKMENKKPSESDKALDNLIDLEKSKINNPENLPNENKESLLHKTLENAFPDQ